MSAPAPGADRLGTLAAFLLAVLALPATGVLALPLLPTTAVGFLGLAVPALAVVLLATALPSTGSRSSALRAVSVLCAALPALVCGCLLASGGSVGARLPGWGLLLAFALCLGLSGASPRIRRGLAALLLGLWGVDSVLSQARMEFLPAELNPVRTPYASIAGTSTRIRLAPGIHRGLRPGAFVRQDERVAQALGSAGPWYLIADEGPVPRGAPLLVVLGPAHGEPLERVPLPAPADPSPGAPAEVYVARGGPAPQHPFDLAGAEATLVTPLAWPADGQASFHADALARYVRLGGLLIGAGESPWPPELERALTGARESLEGSETLLTLGLGRIQRARDQAQALEHLGRWLARSRVHTAFDGLATPPAPPAALTGLAGVAPERRPLGWLLVAFALAFLVLEGGARRPATLVGTLLFPTLAALGGVLLLLPSTGDVRAHPVSFDLGGPGGRRVDACWIQAGERGFVGMADWTGAGALRWTRGEAPWHLELGPDEGGWLIRHGEAPEPDPADVEDRGAAWLREWLLGDVDPARLRYGRAPLRGLKIPGAPTPVGPTLRLAPAR